MSWELKELYELVEMDHVYLESLSEKIRKARFLADKSFTKWNDYVNSNFEIPSIEFDKTTFEVETYLEASFQNIHSTADILAQIINIAILKGYFKEECVSANKLKSQLRCITNGKIVYKSFEGFLASEAFKYINAFVNTIKHRKLIDFVSHGEFGKGLKNKFEIKVSTFKYGKQFRETAIEEITNKYYDEIELHIDNIGNEIIKYLRQI